jgi:hypothetical protein
MRPGPTNSRKYSLTHPPNAYLSIVEQMLPQCLLKTVSWIWALCDKGPEVPVTYTWKVPVGVLDLFVVKVMTEEAPFVSGITVAGEKVQEESSGSPEQESATGFVKLPPREETLTVNWYEVPRRMDTEPPDTEIKKSTPVPVKPRFCGLMSADSLITRRPVRVPEVDGTKETFTMQLAPTFSDAPHALLERKSPVVVIELIIMGASPTLLTVMVWAALTVATI